MKIFKRISSFVLAAAMLTTSVVLASCGSGEKEYKVNVKDALGNPYYSGIIVKFMQNGEQVAMQAVDENGVAAKTLAKGDYDIELSFTGDADAYYYEEGATLSGDKTETDVILANKVTADPKTITVDGSEYDAYTVNVGCTYTELTEGSMTYCLFSPTEAGNYEFSVADGANCDIGYYGAPHFVQTQNLAEVAEKKFTMSVSASMIGSGDSGTSTYVIGIEALDDTTKSCVLGIQRIGEPVKTLADEPWTVYEATYELQAYTLPEGAELKEFDLTADTDAYTLVYNEEDKFYHLDSADGPLVLVRLGEDCEYIACFKTMLDRSGVTKYFFDENGDFVKKESYSECLLEYIEYIDENEGVYPLTEDLKYIIQQRGDYYGWWNIESNGYIFKDSDGNNRTDINPDIAWLLMCCYIG